MEIKFDNKSNRDMSQLQGMITKFYPYAKEQLDIDQPLSVIFISDLENAKDPFGKTAYYSPNENKISLFVDERHPKDMLRSFSHELVHHAQNCKGQFSDIGDVGEGYAQSNPHLRKMEAEAYLLGNGFLVRDYEDGVKENIKMTEASVRKLVRLILEKVDISEKRFANDPKLDKDGDGVPKWADKDDDDKETNEDKDPVDEAWDFGPDLSFLGAKDPDEPEWKRIERERREDPVGSRQAKPSPYSKKKMPYGSSSGRDEGDLSFHENEDPVEEVHGRHPSEQGGIETRLPHNIESDLERVFGPRPERQPGSEEYLDLKMRQFDLVAAGSHRTNVGMEEYNANKQRLRELEAAASSGKETERAEAEEYFGRDLANPKRDDSFEEVDESDPVVRQENLINYLHGEKNSKLFEILSKKWCKNTHGGNENGQP